MEIEIAELPLMGDMEKHGRHISERNWLFWINYAAFLQAQSSFDDNVLEMM